MSDNNEPAFPCPMGGDWPECDRGMTLRDYFAAQALQGMLANSSRDWELAPSFSPEQNVSIRAFAVADAMLKARGE